MNSEREKELVSLLNNYDLAHVSFYEAKKELLAKGYKESEIVYALYSAPFDGKINQPRPENPLHKFYTEHPDLADKLAKRLILIDEEKDFESAVADTGAARLGPDIQSRSYYEVKAADDLGIPYFTLLFLSLVILLVALKLNLSTETARLILNIYSLAITAWFVYEIVRRRMRINKLKKEVNKDK
jgi:hypothetical protein